MGLFDKLFGSKAKPEPEEQQPLLAEWMADDDPRNPFRVRLLNLMVTQSLIATSMNPENAARSVSWMSARGDEFDLSPALEAQHLDCALEFPTATSLPEGLLYTPPSMDEKWVIAWRDGKVVAARSWTGIVEAVGIAKHVGQRLRIERLHVIDRSMLRMGPLPDTFDWLIRAHALRQRIPFPANDEGAALFEASPAAAFAGFGKVIFCATKSWAPPAIAAPLRCDGDLMRAALRGDFDEVRRLAAAGVDVDAPTTYEGYTPLHLAIVRGDVELFELLLSLGADPAIIADRGIHALIIAVVHKAPIRIFETLAKSRLDLKLPNADGFTAMHAAAETNHAAIVPWLLAHGLELEERTRHGYTPLHIAAGVGHVDVAGALIEVGADVVATSPGGTPLDVARAEKKPEMVRLLESGR